MKTFTATVRVSGSMVKTQIQAASFLDAQRLLEAQYGKGNVFFLTEVH